MKLNLQIIVSIFFTLLAHQVNAQSRQTTKFINTVRQVIKKEAAVADDLDWNKFSNNIKSTPYTGNHNTDKELVYSAFINLLREAGDNHSLFLSNEVATQIKKQNSEEIFATSGYLGNNIGYLKIPFCFTFDYQKDVTFADTIVKQIELLDRYDIDKWIIDLRGNRGGNVWPMLSGLTPIIGEGLIGYTIKKQDTTKHIIGKGKINHSNLKVTEYSTKNTFRKIAVLIDNHTGSSGEMLAIAILGFNNTKSFGSATSGLTTSNSTFTFKDGSTLFLATGFMADRNKKIYKNGIIPSVTIDPELNEDTTIQKVIDWLLE